MKRIKLATCLSVLLLSAAPMIACGSENGYAPQTPPVSEVTPQVPPVTEPEVNEPVVIPQITPETEEKPNEPPVSAVTPQERKISYLRVKTNGLNIRTGAGTSYSSLGTIESGTLLPLIGQSGGWYETTYKNRTAFVSADGRYTEPVQLSAGDEKTEAVIAEGAKLLGTPYVYGAVRYHDGKGNKLKNFTVNEFDCSSLMQYIFSRGAGVSLNMTTRTQISQGTAVSKSELKRGDLMFFTNASRKNNTGVERVGHVALYLGDNYILHTASDYAKIEQISSLRWSCFISARRVL